MREANACADISVSRAPDGLNVAQSSTGPLMPQIDDFSELAFWYPIGYTKPHEHLSPFR
jgi:hypothetical protein